jgi:hypothetical protein
MPSAIASPQCPMCSATREQTEGERWFCAAHSSADRIEHVMSPTMVWTAGSLMW